MLFVLIFMHSKNYSLDLNHKTNKYTNIKFNINSVRIYSLLKKNYTYLDNTVPYRYPQKLRLKNSVKIKPYL